MNFSSLWLFPMIEKKAFEEIKVLQKCYFVISNYITINTCDLSITHNFRKAGGGEEVFNFNNKNWKIFLTLSLQKF